MCQPPQDDDDDDDRQEAPIATITMCQPPQDDDDYDDRQVAPIAMHKPPGHVLAHAFLSTLSFFFVVLALMIPSDSATAVLGTSSPSGGVVVAEPTPLPAPKRGKFVGDSFDAQDLYDAYEEIKLEYHSRAFGAATTNKSEWRVLTRKQDVEVSLMEHPSDPNCPYVKMVAVIPTSVQDCWNFLLLERWDETMPKMDPFYEGVELHGDFAHKGVHMILARKRTQRILAFGKRDFVFLSVTDQPLEDGTWVSGSVSVQTPQIPRQDGYTRAFQDSIAFYKPLEGGTKTRVTIICRIDLNDSSEHGAGGWMPMWLYVKTIGATGARSVTSMRSVLIEEKATREAQQQLLLEEEQQEQKMAKPGISSSSLPLVPFWKSKAAIGKQEQETNLPSSNKKGFRGWFQKETKIPEPKPGPPRPRWRRFPKWTPKQEEPPLVNDTWRTLLQWVSKRLFGRS
jgi:hypothetical protein